MDDDIELQPLLAPATATALLTKTFTGSGVAQANQATTNLQIAGSCWRSRESVHEASLLTTETVTDGESIALPGATEATLHSEEESREDENRISPRVTTDFAEVGLTHRTRLDSYTKFIQQKVMDEPVCQPTEEARSGEGPNEVGAASQDSSSALEEHIIDAIECGDVSAVKQWLEEEETRVNDCKGGSASHGHFFVGDGTALHWAAYYGQLEIAKLLLNNGADPYEKARGGETVLHWACQSKVKNEKLVDQLLTVSANAGKESIQRWVRQCEENKELVHRLFKTDDQHPKPNPLAKLPDSKGWTPLHYACYDNNMKLVQQLINAGADPNARNDKKFTPLHLLDGGCDKLLDLLDQNYLLPRINDPVLQEDIIEKIESGKVQVFQRWLKRKKGQVNRYRGGFALNDGLVLEGGTALHWAAYYGQLAIVEALAENGADFRVLNSRKESVLHWACKSQQENEELVKLLVKKVDVNFPDVDGYTALHYASIRGNCNVARELLQASADRIAQSLHGETPVGIAFRSGRKELIDLLDEDRLLPRDDDPELETFIVDAIRCNDKAAVQQWLEMTVKDKDVNCKRGGKHDSKDFEVSNGTALHWAAYYGKMEIAKLLIGKGANPRVMDKNSETVLHWACKSKKENDEMVKLLLRKISGGESRCQVDSVDTEVYSPLRYALRQGHQEAAIQLKKAKADPSSRIAGDKGTKFQVDSTNTEGYTALHYACWQGHQKVAQLLKEAKADPRARSIKSYTPLDFALVGKEPKWELAKLLDDCHLLPRARYPRLETCIIEGGYMGCVQKWLKCHCTDVDHCRDEEEGGTALHWAAYHGQLDIVKLLIENGANPRARANDNGTVLHWACRSEEGNRDLVRLLLKKGCKLDDRDKNGYTPFLLAALQGCYRVVEELLQWDRFSIVVNYRVLAPEAVFKSKDNEGHTPLVKASLKGHHTVVKLLLKRGAIVEPQDLRAAIEEGNEHVVSDLLQSPQWPTLLRQSWEETTPFRELIKKMPDVAKQVLDRCVVSNPETRDPKNKDFEVVLDYSFVEDQDGDARYSSEGDNEPKYYPEKKEEAHKMRFDEVKKQKDCPVKYEPSSKKFNHPLNIMVQHGRLEMLTHPVISSLLQHKWFHFGLWLYLLNLLIYIIFLGFLTAFALVEIPPQSRTCLQVLRNPGISVCDNETERVNSIGEYTAGSGHDSGMVVNDTTRERNLTCIICELSGTTLSSRFACAVIVIMFASIRLLMEASKFCYEPKSYICDWVKFFEVSMFILSIIFVSVFWTPCMCPLKWQWQIGVIAVLLAWINLIGFCANFPSTGIYIIMIGRIFITFVRVVILSMFLLTTFAITFYMTSETPFQQSPFHPAANSMLKIMSMTAGDFSFDSVFAPSGDAEEVTFIYSTVILWIIFLIIMPILFVNMLIGLAVGDTNDVKEKSRLTKLALQVDVILTAEHLLHVLHIHKYFSTKPSPVILTPNKTEVFSFKKAAMKLVKNIIYYLSGGEQYDAVTFKGALKYYLDSESEDKNEMEQMVEYVKEHTMEAKQKHIEVIEKVEEHIEKVIEERMQVLEQLIKEAIPHQQEADKGPPEIS